MAYDSHANFAYGTVLTAPSPATSGTSLVLNSGQGARFPTPPFNVTIWPANTTPDPTNAEIARCTGKSTDTLTLTRATESTSARSVIVGDQVAVAVTAKVLTDIEANAISPEHAIILTIGGGIPSSVTDGADFQMPVPFNCTALRLKATVKAAVNSSMVAKVRTAAGPITTPPTFSDLTGFSVTFSSGNVFASANPADQNLSEGDLLGLSVTSGSGANLLVEVVVVPR